MTRRFFGIGVLLVFVGVVVFARMERTGYHKTVFPRFRLSHTMSPLSAPFYVASELDLWRKHGVEADVSVCFSARACLEKLLGDNADVAVVADTPLAFASHAGNELTVLCSFVKSTHNVWLVVRNDHGIHSVNDLSGKRIAVAMGTTAEFFLDHVAASHHLELNRGEKVNLTPTDAVVAFHNGAVSAAVGWEPQIASMLELGPEMARILEVDYPVEHRFALVTTPNYLKRNPTVARALLATAEEAIRYIHTHESSSIDIVARKTPMSRKGLERVWPYYRFALEAPTIMKGSLELQLQWALQSGRVSRRVEANVDSVLSNRQFQEWQQRASE